MVINSKSINSNFHRYFCIFVILIFYTLLFLGEILAEIETAYNAEDLAILCAAIADEKISRDIYILNLKNIEMSPADYFVICTCDSDIQSKALADAIERRTKTEGYGRPKIEGTDSARWILLDFFDVVMHVMLPETRSFYKLEKLWGDAKFRKIDENGNLEEIKFDAKDLYSELTGSDDEIQDN